MRDLRSINWFQTIFLGALYFLALALPIAEALKQFSVIIIILLGIHLIFKKEIKLEENVLNYSAVGFIVFSLFSAFFALNSNIALKGCIDIFKIIMIFLIIKNMPLKIRHIIIFNKILFLSLTGALFYGLYKFYFYSGEPYVELHSIGQMNHTSIYLLLVFTMALSGFLNRKSSEINHVLLFFIIINTLTGIFIASDQSTMFTSLLLIILLLIFNQSYKNPKVLAISILLIIVPLSMSEYTLTNFLAGIEPRNEVLGTTIQAWLEHGIFFGIGVDNSHYLQDSIHNTYITFLIERGLYGLSLYLLFIFSVLAALLKQYHNTKNDLVTAAIFIWLVNFMISGVNTIFHDENGLLIAIIWGFSLNKHAFASESNH